VPAAQSEQDEALEDEKVPAAHVPMQMTPPVLDSYFPASQSTHAAAPVADMYLPVSHFVHCDTLDVE
jgi:hypothetical protein